MTGRIEHWPAEDILWVLRTHDEDHADILRDWKGEDRMNDLQAHKLKESFEEAAADDEDPEQYVYEDFVERLEKVTPAWGPRRFDPEHTTIPTALNAATDYVDFDGATIIRGIDEANAKRRLPWYNKETVLGILNEAEHRHARDCGEDCDFPHDEVQKARELLRGWYEAT